MVWSLFLRHAAWSTPAPEKGVLAHIRSGEMLVPQCRFHAEGPLDNIMCADGSRQRKSIDGDPTQYNFHIQTLGQVHLHRGVMRNRPDLSPKPPVQDLHGDGGDRLLTEALRLACLICAAAPGGWSLPLRHSTVSRPFQGSQETIGACRNADKHNWRYCFFIG